MKRLKSASAVFVLLTISLSTATTFAANEPLRTAGDRSVDVEHLRLDLDVDLKRQSVEGTATLDFTPLRKLRSLSLDAVGHEVSAVELKTDVSSMKLASRNTGKKLIVSFPEALPAGVRRRIVVHYRVRKPSSGLHFFAPTKERPKTPTMMWSHGEPISSRHWFPSLDQPNERQTTEIIATVPAGFEAVSNGKLVSKTKVDTGRRTRFHWKQEKPHVSYLVSLVVGRFAVHREMWRGRPITYYVSPDRAKDTRPTFGRTVEMLDYFSKRFGIEYPWEKYAQVVVEQFISGGMEHTGATTLYSRVMHDRRALLDSSPDRLIAHELGHQWWGDLVTCRDWAHLWLNEGFATYCEVLWYEHKLGKDERDYLLYSKSRSARTGAALTRPIVDRRYSHPRTMFDSRAYPKGGWVLHMLRNRLGDDAFFRALKRYGTVYAYQTAETSDLRKVFERLTETSLERFFYDWTERPGHPKLKVESKYDPASKFVRIQVSQTQKGDAFHFPLKLALPLPGNRAPIVIERLITEKTQTILLPSPVRPTMIRVDPDFALLAEIEEAKDRDFWQAQLESAPTVAERIRAVEYLAGRKKVADVQLLINALKQDRFYGVRVEAAKALGKSRGAAARDALLSGIRQTHPKVRRACVDALGSFNNDTSVIAPLNQKWKQGDPSYLVEAAVVGTLTKVAKTVDAELLADALRRDSHGEVIRMAAIRGHEKSSDAKALDVLLSWTQPAKPRRCRIAAIGTLHKYLAAHTVSPEQTTAVLNRLTKFLTTARPRVRKAAAESLRDLGKIATPTVSVLQTVSERDADFRVRKAATTALAKIAAASSADGKSVDAEVKSLRKTVEQLQSRNKELEARLKKIEAALKSRSR